MFGADIGGRAVDGMAFACVRATALYQLLESYFEDVKSVWEERFEKRYGYREVSSTRLWLGAWIVASRKRASQELRCDTCGAERLLTLSCKQRGICPSCDAKRAAAFAAFLKDELLENVGHKLFTFTLPKMLRPFFMRQRELLSDFARLA